MLKRIGWKNAILTLSLVPCLVFTGSLATSVAKGEGESRFKQLELFNKILFLIESQYYREVNTEKLIEGAINGMMQTLDPHSAYLSEDVYTKMQEDTRGEFGGLGIEVSQKDGVIVVITPIDDTPAFKAGIKPGDRIVEIEHEPTMGMTLEEAVEKMRGDAGEEIHVGISRDGVEGVKHFTIKREIIKVEAVKAQLIDENFLFLRLTQFQKGSAESIIKAIKKFKKQAQDKGGLEGLILDLRSNPGGLLDEAVNVSSLFLKDGVVVSTEARDKEEKDIRYVNKTGHKELDLSLVVLINGASASASEIVAGAIQDHDRGLVMGTQSFGKGSVQTVAKVEDKKGVKLTIAQYMTPSGKKIQAFGIIPDVEVPEIEEAWIEEAMKERRYIRERDLRNHLTATVETPEEKEERLEREKKERMARAAKIRKMREEKKNKNKDEDDFKKFDPLTDYQVRQAIRFIKGFEVFQRLNDE